MINQIVELLVTLSPDSPIEIIRKVFNELTDQFKFEMGLNVLDQHVAIFKMEHHKEGEIINKNFSELGFKRVKKANTIRLEIESKETLFFPVFLLREVYYRFIPENLKYFTIISLFLSSLMEINLFEWGFEHLSLWEENIRSEVSGMIYSDSEILNVKEFFESHKIAVKMDSKTFFFDYLRRNYKSIEDDYEKFYRKIFFSYQISDPLILRNNKVLETIKILAFIHDKEKIIRNLKDSTNLFENFKNSNEIKSSLSNYNFKKQVNFIKNNTYITPAYQIIWKTLGIIVFRCKITFNALFSPKKIRDMMQSFPFFLTPRYAQVGFSNKLLGFFMMPTIYEKDFKKTLNKLKDLNFIIEYWLFEREITTTALNLNHFREDLAVNKLFPPWQRKYDTSLELLFYLDRGSENSRNLTFLEYLILDRTRYYETTGYSFNPMSDSAARIRSDFIKERDISQDNLVKFSNLLLFFESNEEYKNEILALMTLNWESYYFRFLSFISDLIEFIDLNSTKLPIRRIENEKSLNLLYIRDKNDSMKDLLLQMNPFLKKIYNSVILPIYHKNKKRFKAKISRLRLYKTFLDLCLAFNLIKTSDIMMIIKNNSKAINYFQEMKKVHEIKFKGYKKHARGNKQINGKYIESILLSFVEGESKVISPNLSRTIGMYRSIVRMNFFLIINKNEDTQKKARDLIPFFPRILIEETREFLILDIYSPSFNSQEKNIFYSAIIKIFQNDLIYLTRFLTHGYVGRFTAHQWFDFKNHEYLYNKNIFPQYYNFITSYIKDEYKEIPLSRIPFHESYPPESHSLRDLIETINNRISKQLDEYNKDHIKNLSLFNDELSQYFDGSKDLNVIKNETFYTQYIKSINLIPNFKMFGISQYYLYIKPLDFNEINFKLLLSNIFQNIKHPASIGEEQSFLIKYIFPFENPNLSYINRSLRSRGLYREYCLFRIIKKHVSFQFNTNLSARGWDDGVKMADLFEHHALNKINRENRLDGPKSWKTFDLGNIKTKNFYGKNSEEFDLLTRVYSRKSINFKRLGFNKSFEKKIKEMVKNGMLFPYIRSKNLKLIEKITFIIPEVDLIHHDTILNVLSFFNAWTVNEIVGEFYLKGEKTDEIIHFNNGLMIKLLLPPIELSNIIEVFHDVFKLLNIEKYAILTDMISGESILHSIYDVDELKEFNPLLNLIWDEKSKEWKNYKLYGEFMKENYPPLVLK